MKSILTLIITIICISCGKPTEKNIYMNSDKTQGPSEGQDEKLPSSGEKVLYSEGAIDLDLKSLYKKGSQSNDVDQKFITITETRNLDQKYLNHIEYAKGTRELIVTGKKIILDESDFQGIVSLIQNSKDLYSLSIHAEKIIIDTPLILHQTNINLYAEEIDFAERGSINTSGEEFQFDAEEFTDGKNGLTAGSIKIVADKVKSDSDRFVLIANGTSGQNAGAGRHGVRGTNGRMVDGSNYYYKFTTCSVDPIRKNKIPAGCRIKEEKKGTPSGNGGDARVGGSPGSGGLAGDIFVTNQELLKTGLQIDGNHGREDILRVGGEPGSPIKSCKKYKVTGERSGTEIKGCVTAVKGRDMVAKKAIATEKVVKTPVLFIENWFSEYNVLPMIRFVEEQYLNGHTFLAYNELQKIKQLLNKSEDKIISKKNLDLKLLRFEKQILSRLDYFGHEMTWTPNASLAISYKLFEKEVYSSLKGMFYGTLLLQDYESVESQRLGIINTQKNLFEEIQNSAKELNSKIQQVSKIGHMVDELQVSESEFKEHLKALDDEIKSQAKRNLIPKDSFLNNAVGYFAAASKVVPVGQPTFGLIGAGVEMVHEMSKSDDPIQSIIENGPSLVENFKKINFKKANSELQNKLDELSFEKFTEIEHPIRHETQEQKIERIKREVIKKKKFIDEMIGFYSPVVNAIKDENSKQGVQVSKTALDKEIEKLRKSNKLYQKVISSLKKLMKKQAEVRSELAYINLFITTNLNKINTNYLLISDLSSELLEANSKISHNLKVRIQNYMNDSKERLLFYHYRLGKSFEYRTLKSYGRHLDLFNVFEEMMSLLKNNQKELGSNDLEKLMIIYTDEISYIVSSFIDHIDQANIEKTGFRKNISLNANEVKALNNGDKIFIDLTSINAFGENKENVRLENIQINGKVEIDSNDSELEIIVSHGRESYINKNGLDYLFTHGNESQNEHFWMASINSSTGDIQQAEIDRDNLETLQAILGDAEGLSRLSSRPSGRGYYTIELKKHGSIDSKLKILDLSLEYKFELIE